ncbi:ribose-phosphate pyrophosphokinase [Kineobactrum sediminis]|uniref:ribose-phosphate diphosphokinase n=1 Tax=Kineobactrum sediminis TaxID=1905677 RepID=A0A2N5Y0U4_9GAMM|nr:ribose-phosphate diphosphokinase [Kineobactrum sediminis]PLW82025.1 ribose-phosphate pyrophosphokinase [Kineobactrum sediminis]
MARNEMALFSLHSGKDFAALVAAHLAIDVGLHEERNFPDGEHKIRPLQSVRDRDVYVVQSLFTDHEYSLNDKLVRLLCLIGVLRENGADRITAVIPYLCYSRKERKTQARDPVTSRYIAQLFEAMKLDRIVTLEAHNTAGFDNAFRCNSEHLSARSTFIEHILPDLQDKMITVASPDVGGIKRAEQFREALERRIGVPMGTAFMEKFRSEGAVSGSNVVGEVQDRTVLIVDDMITSGRTLKRAAEAFKDSGATEIIGIATHGNFSAAVDGVVSEPSLASSALARILVTNSIPPRLLPEALYRNTVEMVDVSPLIGEAIHRLHHGGLVSKLEH